MLSGRFPYLLLPSKAHQNALPQVMGLPGQNAMGHKNDAWKCQAKQPSAKLGSNKT